MAYEKELRERYIEAQMIQNQIAEIQKQVQTIDEQITELRYIIQSLDELDGIEDGREVLMPIHNGIFAKAKIMKSDELLVNVGSGTVVKKSPKETQEMLTGQLKQIEEVRSNLVLNFNTLTEKSEQIQEDTKGLLKKYEESQKNV